jgi:hypothetical protein
MTCDHLRLPIGKFAKRDDFIRAFFPLSLKNSYLNQAQRGQKELHEKE